MDTVPSFTVLMRATEVGGEHETCLLEAKNFDASCSGCKHLATAVALDDSEQFLEMTSQIVLR